MVYKYALEKFDVPEVGIKSIRKKNNLKIMTSYNY